MIGIVLFQLLRYLDFEFYFCFQFSLQNCHDSKRLLSSNACLFNENHCLTSLEHISFDCAALVYLFFIWGKPKYSNNICQFQTCCVNVNEGTFFERIHSFFAVLLFFIFKWETLKWFKAIHGWSSFSTKFILFPLSFICCYLKMYNSDGGFIFFKS